MTTIVERLSRCDVQICQEFDPHITALSELAIGQSGEVVGFSVDSDPAISRRLFDLGLAVGVRVRMVRRAPLGDPIVFQIAETDMLLRARDARCVLVKAV